MRSYWPPRGPLTPSRPAVSTRPRSRLLIVAPRVSGQSAAFVTRIHGCDGCGLCHSLARCASAQNERAEANSSSSLRTSCRWPRSSSRNVTSAGSNVALRRVRVAHRRHQSSLFTACAGMTDCSRMSVRSTELELRRSNPAQQTTFASWTHQSVTDVVVVSFARAQPAATHPTEGTHS